MIEIIGLSCPICGSEIIMYDGFFNCDFCGARIRVEVVTEVYGGDCGHIDAGRDRVSGPDSDTENRASMSRPDPDRIAYGK